MDKIVKIAIPTNDGLSVKSGFCGSRGFFVATVKSGIIIDKQMRWNLLSEMMTSEYGYFYNLFDCDVMIVKANECDHEQILASRTIEVFTTSESVITTAFKNYVESMPVLS